MEVCKGSGVCSGEVPLDGHDGEESASVEGVVLSVDSAPGLPENVDLPSPSAAARTSTLFDNVRAAKPLGVGSCGAPSVIVTGLHEARPHHSGYPQMEPFSKCVIDDIASLTV